MEKPNDNIILENAKMMWRNFEGRESQYNRAGDRNFCVFLDDAQAEELQGLGWNVKGLKSKDDPTDVQAYLQVSVGGFGKGRPPRVCMVTSRGRSDLPEELFDILDYTDIAVADLIIRPYDWVVSGKTGRKAYLKSLYIVVDEDELALKYNQIPEVGAPPQRLELEARDPNVIDVEEV